MIPIFSNTLGRDEVQAVADVFQSRWLGRGEHCKTFEREFGEHLGVDSVLLTNCCTSALYIALRVLGIGPGDEVIIPTIHFVACASAVLEMGAQPVFADVDRCSLNILPSELERLRTKKTKAVILLHYGGHPAPMGKIVETVPEVLIIEDAANSPASTYEGMACGTMGHAGVWSFDAMKILVMGDGGALWMFDQDHREQAEMLRYLGLAKKTTSGMDSAGETSRWWEYEIDEPSGRFISNDIMAAIGRQQLKKLPDFIHRRQQIWEMYQEGLKDLPEVKRPPEPLEGCTSSYYLYWIQLARRDELAAYLYEKGVYTTFRYYPLHMVKGFSDGARLPNAEIINNLTLNLPIHQNLSDEEVENIIFLIHRFFNNKGFLIWDGEFCNRPKG